MSMPLATAIEKSLQFLNSRSHSRSLCFSPPTTRSNRAYSARIQPAPIAVAGAFLIVVFDAADRSPHRQDRPKDEAGLAVDRIDTGKMGVGRPPMRVEPAIDDIAVAEQVARPAAEIDEVTGLAASVRLCERRASRVCPRRQRKRCAGNSANRTACVRPAMRPVRCSPAPVRKYTGKHAGRLSLGINWGSADGKAENQ